MTTAQSAERTPPAPEGVRFRLLGTVESWNGDRRIDIGPAKQRCLLAMLLLDANQPVHVEALIDLMWGERPHAHAKNTVQVYVSRLRRALAGCPDVRLVTTGPCYHAEVDPVRVDVHEFRRLVAAAGPDASDEQAAARLRQALALWRGRALDDVAPEHLRRTVCAALEDERLDAWEGLIDSELRMGRHAEVVGRLARLAERHPLREQLTVQLMTALHRSGRRAEALARYRDLRARFAADLGIDPSPRVEELHQRILRDDPTLAPAAAPAPAAPDTPTSTGSTGPTASTASTGPTRTTGSSAPTGTDAGRAGSGRTGGVRTVGTAPRPVPWQIPADVANFTGRTAYLDQLHALLGGDPPGAAASDLTGVPSGNPTGTPTGGSTGGGGDAGPPPVVVSVIAGTAGVGKTALAVHWAHQVRDRFRDGQLYVNLRGYDQRAPMAPAEALDGFLRALGVEAAAIPHDESERAALYRTLLTGRRMLVLLDNARTAEQVRPLLPAAPGCAVLVTSRDNLAGLVARDGATRICLDLLSRAEAHDLLRRILGSSRVDTASPAAETLVDSCARLPLALRVAAELAARRPTATLAELVADLSDERHRLDRLDAAGDDQTAVRAVFSWSYRRLPADAAHTFRLLGLHPGRDTDTHAVAALLGVEPEHARPPLDALAGAHLVEVSSTGRYHMHDLLHAYATERCAQEETAADRGRALTRLFDHYRYAASVAVRVLYPLDADRRPRFAPPAVAARSFADRWGAAAWLEAERPNLLAAAAHAAAGDWPGHSGDLSRTLAVHLHTTAHHVDAHALHSHAVAACRRHRDPYGETQALADLGGVSIRLGRYDEAIGHLRRALTLAREVGDRHAQSRVLSATAGVHFRVGRYHEALECLAESLAEARALGDRYTEGKVLSNIGGVHHRLGHYGMAIEHYQRAVQIAIGSDDRYSEGHVLTKLGLIYERIGRPAEAVGLIQRAVAIHREIGDRYGQAHSLNNLGLAYRGLGRHGVALDHLLRALALFGEIGSRSELAEVQNDIGDTMRDARRFEEALARHHAALAVASQTRDPHQQGRAHHGLGRVKLALGAATAARTHLLRALEIFTDIGTPEAGQVRDDLAALGGATVPDGADPA